MAYLSPLPWRSWLAVILIVLGVASGLSGAGEVPSKEGPPAGLGVLTGQVVRGPTSPVERAGGHPAWQPVAGAKIIIYGAGPEKIATLRTDAQGRYRLSLPPGRYRLEMPAIGSREFSKDLPAWVTVTPGRETTLNIRLDTGLR